MPPDDFAQAVLALFRAHRTIREFRDAPLAPGDLDALLAAAQRAPSGAAVQLATILRISERTLREEMARLAGDQAQVRTAAEFFVLCLDVHRERLLVEHRGGSFGQAPTFALLYGLLDVALLAGNLATAAEACGYGVCFIGALQNHLDEVARVLALPQGVLPVVGLCVGVPAGAPPAVRPRLPRQAVLGENRYPELSAGTLADCFAAMAPITRSGDWFQVLERYWAPGGLAEKRETVLRGALRQQGLEGGAAAPQDPR